MKSVYNFGLAGSIMAVALCSQGCDGGGSTGSGAAGGGGSTSAGASGAGGTTTTQDTTGTTTAAGGHGGSGGAVASGGTGGSGAGQGNPDPMCNPVPVNGDVTAGPFDAPASAPAGASFLSDWPDIPDSGGYRYTQIMDACRMHLDGTKTWHGLAALRIEVQPGDDPLDLGSERAEALIMQDGSGSLFENTNSGTQYYATSYLFPTTWDGTFLQGDAESWSFVYQLYGASALSAGRHQTPGPQIYQLDAANQTLDFSSGDVALGKWTDFVFMYTWATAPTGHVTVWRRDQGEAQFEQVLDVAGVATLPSADPESYYWKQGLYRGPDVNGRTDVFWIGPTARAATFAAAESAAFGTNNGP